MNPAWKNFGLLAAAMLLLIAVPGGRTQSSIPMGKAKDFTSNSYFEPPNERQVKVRLSGAEALPLAGFSWDVRQLRIETFDVAGKTQMVVRAPQCTYALDGAASSPGRLDLQTGDGNFRVTGEGFLWRQAESVLIISNNVRTVIERPAGQGSLL